MTFLTDYVFHQRKIILFLFFFFIVLQNSYFIYGQSRFNGNISGNVVDKETGESLLGVNVFLLKTNYGAATDLDGKYIIKNIPKGTYSITFSMIGFAKKTITGIKIDSPKLIKIDIVLSPTSFETDEVVISVSALENTEAGLLVRRQKSESISDAVGAEQISKSGGSNAEDAVRQIVGASIIRNEVVIRGLGDRYTSIQMNGAEIPSVDPYKRSGEIDIIPSLMIDNVQVIKSFTPDKRGDFSGGTVDIITKSFPESFTFSAVSKVSYVQNLTLKNNGALTYQGGSTDWLGIDDGTRALPSFFRSGQYVANPGSAIRNNDAARKIDRATKSFNDKMSLSRYSAPINQVWSFSFGNQYNVLGNLLGVIGSFTYKNSTNGYANGELNRWDRGVVDPTKTQLDTNFAMNDNMFTKDVLWAALIKTSFKINNSNIISFNSQYNQNGKSTTRYISGSYPYDIDPEWTYEARTLLYQQRNLQLYQLTGHHQIKSFSNVKIEWRASHSGSEQAEPDNRFFYNYVTPDSVYGIKSNLMPERYFRTTKEQQNEFQTDISVPFRQWSNQSSTFKFGGLYTHKNRSFNERRFVYQPASLVGSYLRNEKGNIDSLFSDKYLGWVRTDTIGSYTINRLPMYIQETDQTSNDYDGKDLVYAGYAMINLPLTKRLKFIGGARYQVTDMNVASRSLTVPNAVIDTKDILPSVGIIYSPIESINIRASYGKTMALPSFREISPFLNYDFNGGDAYVGNPKLERSLIDNVDLRFEWYLGAGEIFAVSGYYKKFYKPIEKIIKDAPNKVLSWQNVDDATVYGVEMEMRKGLNFIGDVFKNFTIGGNFSYIYSAVAIAKIELNSIRAYEPNAKAYRPFEGQSPYLINFYLNYENYENGLSAEVYYNTYGKRLYAVGSIGAPDVYDEPFGMLNLTISKRLIQSLHLKFSLKNLLDSTNKKTQTFKGKSYIYNSHKYGRVMSVELKYSI